MSRLDDVKEESDSKSHQSYGVLNKSWGDSGDKKSSAASKTALVVDDGAMCRKACGAMMIEMGFKVEYANDGKEAVDKIFREDPATGVIAVNYYELVMMDNFMPNMDGSDAVTLLRLNGYTGTIIGLTYDIFDEPSKLFRLVCTLIHSFLLSVSPSLSLSRSLSTRLSCSDAINVCHYCMCVVICLTSFLITTVIICYYCSFLSCF
jgi:CheY-like chemotaxis protein